VRIHTCGLTCARKRFAIDGASDCRLVLIDSFTALTVLQHHVRLPVRTASRPGNAGKILRKFLI